MPPSLDPRSRSVKTLAWLGDAEFERDVRTRIAMRADYTPDRLDAVKARIVRAEAQAHLLDSIEASLQDDELTIVRRSRNTHVRRTARHVRDTRSYRAASALEALVAYWLLAGPHGEARYEQLVVPHLEHAITQSLAVLASRRFVRH